MLKEKHWKTVYIHLKNNTLQFSSRRKVAYLDMLRAQKENNKALNYFPCRSFLFKNLNNFVMVLTFYQGIQLKKLTNTRK